MELKCMFSLRKRHRGQPTRCYVEEDGERKDLKGQSNRKCGEQCGKVECGTFLQDKVQSVWVGEIRESYCEHYYCWKADN